MLRVNLIVDFLEELVFQGMHFLAITYGAIQRISFTRCVDSPLLHPELGWEALPHEFVESN